MKNIITVLILFIGLSGKAQFMEFGGGPGIMNYSGDLVRGFSFSTTTPAATAFYRMNFSEIVTLRLAATIGSAKANETPIDAFAVQRDHRFKNSVLEVTSVFEYHFFDFKAVNARKQWSPYIFGGFGFISLGEVPSNPNVGKFQPVLPVGFGVKHIFAKKFTVGFETGARKMFFDEIDGVSNGDQTNKDYQYGNPRDNDWIFFTGISLSITLFNIPCPFPYVPNNSILSR